MTVLYFARIIEAFCFAVYFIHQSIKDIKTMRVSVLWNNAAVLLTVILYLARLDSIHSIHPDVCLISLLICGFSFAGFYSSGDAKAYLAIYFGTTLYASAGNLRTDVFLVGVIAGCVTALAVYYIPRKLLNRKLIQEVKVDGKNRFAYFPFLAVSCLVTFVLSAVFPVM